MVDRSLMALSGVNLAVAGMQTGLGAFLPVYLATHGWHHAEIGFALSLAIVSTMAAQLPGGAMVDAMAHKRRAAGVAIVAVALSALTIGVVADHTWVLAAQIVQGAAAAVLVPAIAAITLTLSRHDALGERFGSNVRFAALGSVAAASAMGLVGTYSHRAILLAAAALGGLALLALSGIRVADVEAGPTRTTHAAVQPKERRKGKQSPIWELLWDRRLVVFVAAMALFQLGNAALLPIASNGWSLLLGARTDWRDHAAAGLGGGGFALVWSTGGNLWAETGAIARVFGAAGASGFVRTGWQPISGSCLARLGWHYRGCIRGNDTVGGRGYYP